MLVYGERTREVDPAEVAERLLDQGLAIRKMPHGLARHSALVSLLIDIGELKSGLADARDIESGLTEQGLSSIHAWNLNNIPSHYPRIVHRSDASGSIANALYHSCVEQGVLADRWRRQVGDVEMVLSALYRTRNPRYTAKRINAINIKPLEGFAYYSLYPEMYMQAGLQLLNQDETKDIAIISILSIGLPLGEVMWATLAAHSRHVGHYSVRPVGHPFSRVLQVLDTDYSVETVKHAVEQQQLHLIVDEGPGLSGSSFGAVADWLEGQGLARERIAFFPSHDNPLGPQASAAHRERWAAARKYVASFENVFIETGKLAEWVADLTGGVGKLEDIGYGRWRAKLLPAQDWPPINIQQERRKYLCWAGGRQWLLKFAGLGHYGEDKLPLARSLAAAGFTVPLVGLRHGFIVSEWLAEAKPLTNALLQQIDRARLVDFIAAYLAHRASHFPAAAGAGATVQQLFEMMRYNTAQSIGEQYAARLDRWQDQLDELAAAERRVLTDNKMQPWEWLLLPAGRLLKADALDHHAAHDLIGAQGIGWDIVGAITELNLSRDEAQRLLAAFAAKAGYRPTSQQLAFYTHAYIAFQAGHYTLAATALGDEPDEATRLGEAASAWAARLGERIDLPPNYELE